MDQKGGDKRGTSAHLLCITNKHTPHICAMNGCSIVMREKKKGYCGISSKGGSICFVVGLVVGLKIWLEVMSVVGWLVGGWVICCCYC